MDAIRHVCFFSEAVVEKGGGGGTSGIVGYCERLQLPPLGLSGAAFEHLQLLPYLRAVLWDYLRGRTFAYKDGTGAVCERRMYRGVPQGSVLGLMLWNFGYDVVLRAVLPPGFDVVCYADDTLVMARGED